MPEYNKYSRDLWDYIEDLPYMPSRADREKFFWDNEKRERIKLWDYFFRIKPEDVGKPQRKEISLIIKEVRELTEKCKQREKEILDTIKELERIALIKVITRFFAGSIVLGIILFIFSRIPVLGTTFKDVYSVSFPLSWLIILGIFVGVGYVAGGDKRECRILAIRLKGYKEKNFIMIDEAKRRISALKKEVARLRRQVPEPISGEDAREWLNREFDKLWNYARTEVALVRDIIKIQGDNPSEEIKNPLYVLGPGELQQKIPRHFLEYVDEDLHKHLGAKKTHHLDPNKHGVMLDILYGIYFLEYIIVATDMLVTHSFYYDFIDDKVTSEYTTEQYYTDVVALAIENEDRKITIENGIGELTSTYVEDSPTFTLSLKSGEIHKVSFVNRDYFVKVREKLNVTVEDVDKIYWISEARKNSDNVIKALRHYIRQHKHD